MLITPSAFYHIVTNFSIGSVFGVQVKTMEVGDEMGSEKIYVNIDFIKPGAVSTKYHTHSKREEFFLILHGTGILRMNEKEMPVEAGDMIAKPAGKNIAHQFINLGTEILQILDIGTREEDDIITYPDENRVYIKRNKMVFDLCDEDKEWTSEPNID
jgi:uncharacterized cupin superfamily protein